MPEAGIGAGLIRLLEQSVWANTRWIELVYSEPDLETRPFELLAHIVISEGIWFQRIAGEPETQASFTVLAKDDLLRRLEENGETFRKLVPSRLEDVIHFTRASGEKYHARVADILHHLVTHGYHHRGQLARHYARKGVAYPNTDHINFLLENRL